MAVTQLYKLLPTSVLTLSTSLCWAQDTDQDPLVVFATEEEHIPTEEYLGKDTESATRLNLAPEETPQSISYITQKRIQEQNLRSVDAVILQAPGITLNKFDHITRQKSFDLHK